jgi:5-methylcytosine-specific restriction endonuclease McrA
VPACSHCGREFETERGLKIHRGHVHEGSQDPRECPTCGEEFSNEHGVKIHRARAHDEDVSGTTVACSTCGNPTTKQRHEIEKYEHHFCSGNCERDWRSERYAGERNPNYTERVAVTCEQCGKTEDVPPWREGTYRFCSKGCKATWQSENRSGEAAFAWEGGLITIECEWCGGFDDVYPAVAADARFCSPECFAAWRSTTQTGDKNPSWKGGPETLVCEQCNDDYTVTPAKVEGSRFCSPECFDDWRAEHTTGADNPNWAGGYEGYYGEDWRRQRRKARDRDRYCCWLCGLTDEMSQGIFDAELSVHHVRSAADFDSQEEANELGNLLTVCIFCHSRVF